MSVFFAEQLSQTLDKPWIDDKFFLFLRLGSAAVRKRQHVHFIRFRSLLLYEERTNIQNVPSIIHK